MKPAPFDYHAPLALDEALALLAGAAGDAAPLAGGQSLLPRMNARQARPAVVVDLRRVAGLDAIGDGDPLRIGAMVRHRTLERDPLIAERLGLLAEAARHVASIGVRSRGTLGGSLAHADPAAELPAACVALDAMLVLRAGDGERRLPARELFAGAFATTLRPGELIVAVEVPAPAAGSGWGFSEVARVHGGPAQAGACALVDAAGAHGRLVLFAVGATPVVLEGELETLLDGQLDALPHPPRDPRYRRSLARVVAGRAIEAARERAGRTR